MIKKVAKVLLLSIAIFACIAGSFLLSPKEVYVDFTPEGECTDTNAHINSEKDYNIEIYNLVKSEVEQEFTYKGFPKNTQIGTGRDNVEINMFDDFACINYKYGKIFRNYLRYHIEDQLVVLNKNTKEATVLYTSSKDERIVYGNEQKVILFDTSENLLKVKTIANNKTEKTIDLRKSIFLPEYYFEVQTDSGLLTVTKDNYCMHDLLPETIKLNDLL